MKLLGLVSGVAMALAVVAPSASQAQSFPERQIQLVVPFKPGGGSDRIARAVDAHAEKEFGSSFAFDYKPGAGGHIGMSGLARAKGDGYTIGTFNTPAIAIGPLTGAAQYTLDDFTYIGQIAFDPAIMFSSTNKSIGSVADLIEKAKADPGSMSLGVAGAKGGTHLAALQFLSKAGVDLNVVIFPGGSDLAAAVLGGQVDVGMSGIAPFLGSMEAVVPLAVLSEERTEKLAETPTLKETGIDLTASTGRVLVAPRIEDEAVVKRLRDGIRSIAENPDLQSTLVASGQTPKWIDGAKLEALLKAYQVEASETISTNGL